MMRDTQPTALLIRAGEKPFQNARGNGEIGGIDIRQLFTLVARQVFNHLTAPPFSGFRQRETVTIKQ